LLSEPAQARQPYRDYVLSIAAIRHYYLGELVDLTADGEDVVVQGPLLTELVISHREDGSALVRVTADGPIEGSDVSFFGVRVPPPRNILVIPGAGLPGEDAVLPVRDGLLCDIGVEFVKEGAVRTELVFYLSSSEVTFEKAAVKGTHAVILLRPPANPHAPLICEVESRMRSRTWHFIATGPPQEVPIDAD